MNALTEHHLNILHWLAEGLARKEVGLQLGLSVKTVEWHIYRLKKHFHHEGTDAGLVIVAMREGLLK